MSEPLKENLPPELNIPSQEAATCSNCPYWERLIDPRAPKNLGTCRYNPPRLLVLPQQTLQGESVGVSSVFPQTDENAWCGQHPERRAAAFGTMFDIGLQIVTEEFPQFFPGKTGGLH